MTVKMKLWLFMIIGVIESLVNGLPLAQREDNLDPRFHDEHNEVSPEDSLASQEAKEGKRVPLWATILVIVICVGVFIYFAISCGLLKKCLRSRDTAQLPENAQNEAEGARPHNISLDSTSTVTTTSSNVTKREKVSENQVVSALSDKSKNGSQDPGQNNAASDSALDESISSSEDLSEDAQHVEEKSLQNPLPNNIHKRQDHEQLTTSTEEDSDFEICPEDTFQEGMKALESRYLFLSDANKVGNLETITELPEAAGDHTTMPMPSSEQAMSLEPSLSTEDIEILEEDSNNYGQLMSEKALDNKCPTVPYAPTALNASDAVAHECECPILTKTAKQSAVNDLPEAVPKIEPAGITLDVTFDEATGAADDNKDATDLVKVGKFPYAPFARVLNEQHCIEDESKGIVCSEKLEEAYDEVHDVVGERNYGYTQDEIMSPTGDSQTQLNESLITADKANSKLRNDMDGRNPNQHDLPGHIYLADTTVEVKSNEDTDKDDCCSTIKSPSNSPGEDADEIVRKDAIDILDNNSSHSSSLEKVLYNTKKGDINNDTVYSSSGDKDLTRDIAPEILGADDVVIKELIDVNYAPFMIGKAVVHDISDISNEKSTNGGEAVLQEESIDMSSHSAQDTEAIVCRSKSHSVKILESEETGNIDIKNAPVNVQAAKVVSSYEEESADIKVTSGYDTEKLKAIGASDPDSPDPDNMLTEALEPEESSAHNDSIGMRILNSVTALINEM